MPTVLFLWAVPPTSLLTCVVVAAPPPWAKWTDLHQDLLQAAEILDSLQVLGDRRRKLTNPDLSTCSSLKTSLLAAQIMLMIIQEHG